MAESFYHYHRASTADDRETAYRIWRENSYEPYRLAVLEKAKPESKQYQAAMRSEDEIRATWFKRYRKPVDLWSD